jgi:hypothetical protein
MNNKKYIKYLSKNMIGNGKITDLPSDITQSVLQQIVYSDEEFQNLVQKACYDIYRGEKNMLQWNAIVLISKSLQKISLFYDISTRENFFEQFIQNMDFFRFNEIYDIEYINYILNPTNSFQNIKKVEFICCDIEYSELIIHEGFEELIIRFYTRLDNESKLEDEDNDDYFTKDDLFEYEYINIILPKLPLSTQKIIVDCYNYKYLDDKYFKDYRNRKHFLISLYEFYNNQQNHHLKIGDISNLTNLKVLHMNVWNASIDSNFPPNIEELYLPTRDGKHDDTKISMFREYSEEDYSYDYDMEYKLKYIRRFKKIYVPNNTQLQSRFFSHDDDSRLNISTYELYIVEHELKEIDSTFIYDLMTPYLKKLHFFKYKLFDSRSYQIKRSDEIKYKIKSKNIEELVLHGFINDVIDLTEFTKLKHLYLDKLNQNDILPITIESLVIYVNNCDNLQYLINLKSLVIIYEYDALPIKLLPNSLEYICAKKDDILDIMTRFKNIRLIEEKDNDVINSFFANSIVINKFDKKERDYLVVAKVTFIA